WASSLGWNGRGWKLHVTMHTRISALTLFILAAGAAPAAGQIFGAQPRPQTPSVCESFVPLRQEAETNMAAVKAATERKAPREEFCELFKKMSGTTAKISKFFEQHQTECGIPAEAIQRAKLDHSKITTYRKQACSAAPGPAGPRLSDVLGAPLLPDSSANK